MSSVPRPFARPLTDGPDTPDTPAAPDRTGRRNLLRAGGIGGLLIAATAAGTQPAAAKGPKGAARIRAVTDVAALRALSPKQLEDGEVAVVAGYRTAGDGGGASLRWDASSAAAHNAGTVLAPASPGPRGRWLQLHDGVVDFRTFGHFDDGAPADAALDALVNDASVHRIEAHTDLLFTRRHTFGRSGIELDFGGHRVRTTGIERNTADNPFGAVLLFQGKVTDTKVTATLSAPMPDLADVFEVPDSGAFEVGQWWAVEVDGVKGGGKYEREVQRLVQITQKVDGTHVRVNYKIGWELAAGRTFRWTRVEPVERAHVRNMVFEGVKGGDQYTGSHPVAYEYAVSCDVSGIDATDTFWPVVMRRWCTYFHTYQCQLRNPASVTWGGAGYLTQQIYCLYGHVEDCHASNARHLNDWTASAYGYVTNCHGDGDDQGPFVTHGQFEHDLVYTGNSGLMTFANSGAAWGSAAKRITVRQHVCSWFVARVKVTDLTLEDLRVIGNSQSGSGMIWVNADGVQMRGCTASGPLVITQASKLSRRANVVADSTFHQGKGSVVTQENVSADVHLERVTLTGLDGAAFKGTGDLVLERCVFTGASDKAAPSSLAHPATTVSGGRYRDTGFVLNSGKDQEIRLDGGARFSGTNGAGALLGRTGGERTVSWRLDGFHGETAVSDTAHLKITEGTNRYQASNSTFSGGRLELAAGAFAGSGHLLHSGCVEDGTRRTAMPPEGDRIRHEAGNLLLG
ncbi:peptidase C14 [Streptomyces sp. NPDC020412]|uniref:peptidase C14 n=1 Tax=Streptomyces sp. NPDC020412 TaxID=3365073 RepID=UPI00379BDAEE